jgi:hypothetical protein
MSSKLLFPRLSSKTWRASLSHRAISSSRHHSTSIDDDARILSKLGLGSHQWAKLITNNDSTAYHQVIRTALENLVDTIEAGQEGGALALAKAYQAALDENPSLKQHPVTFIMRIGYRTVLEDSNDGTIKVPASLPNDVKVEEFNYDPTRAGSSPTIPTQGNSSINSSKARVYHNIGSDAIIYAMETCPLLQLARLHPQVSILPMLHNPEVQGSQLGAPMQERQARIQTMLMEGFDALEQFLAMESSSSPAICNYGVVSNGICLPSDHPLYLNYQTVLQAAASAQGSRNNKKKQQQAQSHFSVLQLPANVLERQGFDIAKAAKREWATMNGVSSSLEQPPALQVYGMRPLTCYPDRGTGNGRPIVLADHLLSTEMESSSSSSSIHTLSEQRQPTHIWTNEMTNVPAQYHIAFRTAVSHFDADALLQRKIQNEHSLT